MQRRHHFIQRFNAQGAVHLVCLMAAGAMLGGCSKPLLSPTETRSQFDRYDRARNQFAAQYVEDEFGHRQPNLRARLAPKN